LLKHLFFSLAKEHAIYRNAFEISLASWELDPKIRVKEANQSSYILLLTFPSSK